MSELQLSQLQARRCAVLADPYPRTRTTRTHGDARCAQPRTHRDTFAHSTAQHSRARLHARSAAAGTRAVRRRCCGDCAIIALLIGPQGALTNTLAGVVGSRFRSMRASPPHAHTQSQSALPGLVPLRCAHRSPAGSRCDSTPMPLPRAVLRAVVSRHERVDGRALTSGQTLQRVSCRAGFCAHTAPACVHRDGLAQPNQQKPGRCQGRSYVVSLGHRWY